MTNRRPYTLAIRQQQQEEHRYVPCISSEPLQHSPSLKKMKSTSSRRDRSRTNEISERSVSSCIDDSRNSGSSQCISSSGFFTSGSNVKCIRVRSGSRSSNREFQASQHRSHSDGSRWGRSIHGDNWARGGSESNTYVKHTPTTFSSYSSSFSKEEELGFGSEYSPAAVIKRLLQSQRLKRWLHYSILLLRCSSASLTATLSPSARNAYLHSSQESRLNWPVLCRVACCCMCLLVGACCVVAATYWCVSLCILAKTFASLDFPSAYEKPSWQPVSLSAPIVFPLKALAGGSAAAASGSVSVTKFDNFVVQENVRAQILEDRKVEGFIHVLPKQQRAQLVQDLLHRLHQPSPMGQSAQTQQQAQYVGQQQHSLEPPETSKARAHVFSGERRVQRDNPKTKKQNDILQYIWQRDIAKSLGTQQEHHVVGAAAKRQLGRTIQVGPPDNYTGFNAGLVWAAFKEAPQDYLLALLFLVSTVLFCFFCSWLCQQRSYQKAILVSP